MEGLHPRRGLCRLETQDEDLVRELERDLVARGYRRRRDHRSLRVGEYSIVRVGETIRIRWCESRQEERGARGAA